LLTTWPLEKWYCDDCKAKKKPNYIATRRPPIRTETPSESIKRGSNKLKVYAVGDEVSFKRRKGEDLDWIQGIVTRVVGDGKSRQYEIQDLYPDAVDLNSIYYKSSTSKMVPIPPANAKFEDYEIGKRVLALYPTTSTFYQANVKRMLEGCTKVEVLFEEEQERKEVERRMVLNHTEGFGLRRPVDNRATQRPSTSIGPAGYKPIWNDQDKQW
jgi:hypothetical protein